MSRITIRSSPMAHGPDGDSAPMTAPPGRGPEAESEKAPANAVLLEVAWEVCNQLGGIYQVIRSKASRMVDRWGPRYLLVGPYVHEKAELEFEPTAPTGWLQKVIDELGAAGLVVHHGRWMIPGRPKTLLIEHALPLDRHDAVKFRLWSDHQIPMPWGRDGLIDPVVSFADAVRRLSASVCRHWRGGSTGGANAPAEDAPAGKSTGRVIVHCHEWMGGLAIPMMRREQIPAAVVFTTHATLLGRYAASGDEWFYDHLPFYKQAEEAKKFNIECQHGIERACAHGSHVFTTVSPITGEECEHLLGRKVDLVLPNGLNIDRYNVGHDFQTFHAQFKQRIHDFVMGHFFPHYSFDLDKTLYVFTSGRYEPRNKGFDLCLEAMARLNAMLKGAGLGVNVVFFVITRRDTRSINPRVLEARGVLNELRDVCSRITADIGDKFFRRTAAGKQVKLDKLVDEYWKLRVRRTQHALKRAGNPPVCTHVFDDEASDPVLTQIRNLWITNREDDPVKVVYHPDFVKPESPLWGLEYEQFVRGCHLGIFPSAYEPWGYTPLECVAMGVPAFTSDLAGFGRYVADVFPDHERWGLSVLRRRGRSYSDAAGDLAGKLLDFCTLDRRGRIHLRNEVEQRSWEFDWGTLGKAYDWAHDLAMVRAAAGSI
jgi:glycogen(starch) synthase